MVASIKSTIVVKIIPRYFGDRHKFYAMPASDTLQWYC